MQRRSLTGHTDMRLDIYHHMVYDDNCKELDIKQSLNSIFNILKQIKMEQSELAAQLTASPSSGDGGTTFSVLPLLLKLIL